MRSPKFIFSAPSIKACTSAYHIQRAWKDKVKRQLRKQVLWDLIEFRDIDRELPVSSYQLANEIANASFSVCKPQTYLVEKSRGLCRQMTLIQPHDLVVLQCLSTRVHTQIVRGSPSKAAFFQPGDLKWSTGKMTISDDAYGSVASWKRFQKQVLSFSRENKYVVITDVANFYDFINFKHLRNIVASVCKDVEEAVLDLLIYLLNELAWVPDYMPRLELGMPQIETEAPRVLANAMLFELDRVVEQHSYQNYARFMDDIDFGVQTIAQAKRAVRDIDLTLQSRQLRLNSAKTQILTQREAFKHFCVKENHDLDRYARLIELTGFFHILKPRIGKSLSRLYEKWLERIPTGAPGKNSILMQGNGSKIHKRIFTLMRACDVHPPIDDLVWLIKNSPEMRSPALRTLVHTNKPNEAFNKLLPILKSDFFVDDITHIEFANFCVHSRLKRTTKLLNGLEDAARTLLPRGMIGAYAASLVLGRAANPQRLLEHAIELEPLWRNDYWLGRCIAGLYPRLHAAPAAIGREYLQLLRSANNPACDSVVDYHFALMTDAAFVKQCSNYLKHDNESFPLKIFFPKALQVLSVKQNASAASSYTSILTKQAVLSSDPFFKEWGFYGVPPSGGPV